MKLSNRQLARNLYTALSEVQKSEESQVLKNFVEMIYKMRKLSQIDRIIEEYSAYEKEMNGGVTLVVTTARKLSDEVKKMLEKELGNQVTVEEKVDINILGGIIVRSKNTIYDASIKTSIDQLKTIL